MCAVTSQLDTWSHVLLIIVPTILSGQVEGLISLTEQLLTSIITDTLPLYHIPLQSHIYTITTTHWKTHYLH